jgi:hypothetical protein
MKKSDVEIVYNIFEKIPKTFSISLQIQILKNKKILESEFSLISQIKKNLYLEEFVEYITKLRELESGKLSIDSLNIEYEDYINIQRIRIAEYEKYLREDFEDADKLFFINIEDLPDDLENIDKDFLEGLFLITH